jgi:hypothetical protein
VRQERDHPSHYLKIQERRYDKPKFLVDRLALNGWQRCCLGTEQLQRLNTLRNLPCSFYSVFGLVRRQQQRQHLRGRKDLRRLRYDSAGGGIVDRSV